MKEYPFQGRIPREIPFSESQIDIIDKEVPTLVQKGAIKQVPPSEDQFISTIFIVPKKDGSFRPIINLKYLNEFVEYHHFKQENLAFALGLLKPNDFF